MLKFIRSTLAALVLLSFSPTGQITSKALSNASHVKVLTSGDDYLVLDAVAPEFQFEHLSYDTGDYDSLIIPGADTTFAPGEPQLPVLNALVGVPPGAEVKVEILYDEQSQIPGIFSLAPGPTPLRLDQDLEPGKYTYIQDQAAYSRNAWYPEYPARIEDDAWIRDQRIARIAIYPLQYNPAQGTLLWHRQLQVKVTFSGTRAEEITNLASEGAVLDSKSGRDENPFDPILKDNLLNYEKAKEWRGFETHSTFEQSLKLDSESTAVKITVDHDGLYRLTYQDLVDAGFELAGIDPRYFWMSNQGQDVAITINGEGDGVFNSEDTIVFYGEGFRGDRMAEIYADEDQHWVNEFVYQPDYSSVYFDAQLNATMFEKYTTKNVYWLSVEDSSGPRIGEIDGTPAGADIPSYYWETDHKEESHIWWTYHFTEEDTWLWDLSSRKDPTSLVTRTYTTTINSLPTGSYSATIRGKVVAYTSNYYAEPDHHTQFFINTTLIDEAFWDGHIEYTFEAQTSQTNLKEGENELLFVAHDTPAIYWEYIYFDWFEIIYARQFKAMDNQLIFSNELGGTFQYQSHGFTDDNIQVFDITTSISPTRVISPLITFDGTSTYTATFQVSHDPNARYYLTAVGDETVYQSPSSISTYTPVDFDAIAGADYVLITHSAFLTATQALADYRSGQGLSTLVVDVDELYNQFNYGIYHPIAIKAFLAYTFENWSTPPVYAVLVGDGHWDMLGFRKDTADQPIYMPPNLAFVDPWQGEVDSANLLANVVGDDILPDIAISRIPVDSEQELYNIIDKIITFEAASWQDWQRNLVFVADNVPDSAGNFVDTSDMIINNHIASGYTPIRIYQNDFNCPSSDPSACKAVTNAITSTMNTTGTMIINYIGHGDIYEWSDEKILHLSHLSTLENKAMPSIFLDMTCLTGYWIHPVYQSLVVNLLTLQDAGAVSTFSPTGLGVGLGHESLLIGFYDALFKSGVRELGGATLAAKLRLFQAGYSYDLINTFTIFGDPALKIPILQSIYFPSIFR